MPPRGSSSLRGIPGGRGLSDTAVAAALQPSWGEGGKSRKTLGWVGRAEGEGVIGDPQGRRLLQVAGAGDVGPALPSGSHRSGAPRLRCPPARGTEARGHAWPTAPALPCAHSGLSLEPQSLAEPRPPPTDTCWGT